MKMESKKQKLIVWLAVGLGAAVLAPQSASAQTVPWSECEPRDNLCVCEWVDIPWGPVGYDCYIIPCNAVPPAVCAETLPPPTDPPSVTPPLEEPAKRTDWLRSLWNRITGGVVGWVKPKPSTKRPDNDT